MCSVKNNGTADVAVDHSAPMSNNGGHHHNQGGYQGSRYGGRPQYRGKSNTYQQYHRRYAPYGGNNNVEGAQSYDSYHSHTNGPYPRRYTYAPQHTNDYYVEHNSTRYNNTNTNPIVGTNVSNFNTDTSRAASNGSVLETKLPSKSLTPSPVPTDITDHNNNNTTSSSSSTLDPDAVIGQMLQWDNVTTDDTDAKLQHLKILCFTSEFETDIYLNQCERDALNVSETQDNLNNLLLM